MRSLIKNILAKFDLEIHRITPSEQDVLSNVEVLNDVQLKRKKLFDTHLDYLTFNDFTIDEIDMINSSLPFTMTGPLRTISLIRAVEYIIINKIPGDFVECGVWKGGSMMLLAKTLLKHGINNRDLYLYDTFEGMSEPTDLDISFDDKKAENLLKLEIDAKQNGYNVWCYSTLEEVKENMISTGYNADNIHLYKGKVEETIPGKIPQKIALLRLDTDWYESTLHELKYLYPLLTQKGVLIIDDYGQWMGQRKAVDEYIAQNEIDIFLNRIDFSSRLAIKV